eukprot:scaffold35233_cov59-Cyclotella_meneghiniana.AAC.6
MAILRTHNIDRAISIIAGKHLHLNVVKRLDGVPRFDLFLVPDGSSLNGDMDLRGNNSHVVVVGKQADC